MILRKVILFICLIFLHTSLFAQTSEVSNIKKQDSAKSKTPEKSIDSIAKKDTLLNSTVKSGIDSSITKDTIQSFVPKVRSGYLLSGKILDFNTGEGIPFATVFFPHTATGTATNLDGDFIIHVESLPKDTLQIEALGYSVIVKKLLLNQHERTFKIEMHRAATSLNEFTLHAKGVDPALLLVKRIIQHKPQNNPDRTRNYKYEAYNRIEIDLKNISPKKINKIPILNKYGFLINNVDTSSESDPYLPGYLTETISDYYFRRSPKKEREIIKGSMAKGIKNEGIVNYLGTAYQNINVYDNSIPVMDKNFISPISNEGPLFYRYAIKDTQRAFGHNIILVQFRPKRDAELCFTGDFWVVDTLYAIERVSMEVPKLANVNWTDKVSLYQEFAPVDTFWFCTKDKFIAALSAYGSKKIPGVIARKTTNYHHIVVNDSMVDVEIDNPNWRDRIIKLDSASQKTDNWWKVNRPDTLTKTELSIYKMVDTILAMPITQHYINVLTFLIGGVKDIGYLELGPYWYIYSHNPHEGDRVRLSLGTARNLDNLHLTGYVAYGFNDNVVKYGFEERWVIKRTPWIYLYSKYIHDMNQGVDNFDHPRSDNIFNTLVRKSDIPWKQAFSDLQRIEYNRQGFSGFSQTLILQHHTYTPFAPLPSTGVFFDKDGNAAQSVISSEVGLEFRYAYHEKYLNSKYRRENFGSKYPAFDAIYTVGYKNILNSAYDYKKFNISIKETINVPPFGSISYNVFGGKYFGKLPYPLLEVHPGNEYLYYDKNAFQMMNNYEFISDEFVGCTFEHDLGGGIFNHIPLLNKLKLRQFWNIKGVIGTLSNENRQLNINPALPFQFRTLDGTPYVEVGTGITNIFQLFRVDFVWRVMPTPIGTELLSKYFGVFGSVVVDF